MKNNIKDRIYFKWLNLWPLCNKIDATIHFQFRLSWSLNQVISIYFLFANLGFNFILFKKQKPVKKFHTEQWTSDNGTQTDLHMYL